ncbi:MAG TPA: PilZ domain-containing protein [Anaeromyxobacteraceae bacterium]|nr:PilZ domain-containing protein [Anaeromyxobacteraceae bacterium]
MSLAAFLSRFRELHRKDAAGSLSAGEREEYRSGRDELARALLAVQRLSLKPGETARQSLRVARALQVDLEWPKGKVRSVTLDLSAGGFATLMAKAPSQSDDVECVFRLPGGDEMKARARVVNIQVQGAAVRVAFAFQKLPEEDRARLERVVFDTVLAQLGP